MTFFTTLLKVVCCNEYDVLLVSHNGVAINQAQNFKSHGISSGKKVLHMVMKNEERIYVSHYNCIVIPISPFSVS